MARRREGGGYKEMTRYQKKGYKMSKGAGKLATDTVESKAPGNYKSRYKGSLSPESEIVESPFKASYKSRYK